MAKAIKGKAYGSIPHLPTSRLGPADHSCHAGQAVICTERVRDERDRVIVTEKLDGHCVALVRFGDEIHAIGRAGHFASDSPYPQIRDFHNWLFSLDYERFWGIPDGWRVAGEWMGSPAGSLYAYCGEPFIPFDVFDNTGKRLRHDQAQEMFQSLELPGPAILHDGPSAFGIDAAVEALGERGFHGCLDRPEGAVWRVERDGKFDFLAKWVSPDKIDGRLIPGLCGNSPEMPMIKNPIWR